MVKVRALFFAYNKQTCFRFPDIDLEAGRNLLVLGESGIGKTTLLHLLAGLLWPKSGSVEVMGTVLHEMSLAKLDRFRGRHIGLVFQRPHFVLALSLAENLALVQYLAGKQQDKNRISEVLDSLGIRHKLHEKPYRLSQGEQQRAAIALAVVNNPRLILADEPTSSLDDKNCMKVAALLKEQASATGAQLIIITHDQRLKAQFQNTLIL
ncbi:MAG: ATP-binding cassette domain-containing protein [Cyclobacteriaceae bacterium]|nr:ATP-binding cassette domain-containing protein [Cyclobacteriaceae bacterium]